MSGKAPIVEFDELVNRVTEAMKDLQKFKDDPSLFVKNAQGDIKVHSFRIWKKDLELFKDIQYTISIHQRNPEYTQQELLHTLLKNYASTITVLPRPEELKTKSKNRSLAISKGKDNHG